MSASPLAFAKYGLGVSVGLILMVVSFETYHWSNYMQANPAVQNISTMTAGVVFYLILFVLGTVIAYAAFATGLQRAVQQNT